MQANVSSVSDTRRRLSTTVLKGVALLLSPINWAIGGLLQLPFVRDISKLIQFAGKVIAGIALIAVAVLRTINQAAKWVNQKFGTREESVLSNRPFGTISDTRWATLSRAKNLLSRPHRNDLVPSLVERLSGKQKIIESATTEKKDILLKTIPNTQTMNEKNLDFLANQIKLTGYGADHKSELREELKKQNPSFTLYHQADYGKDSTVSALHFKKSTTSDMYFFNSHSIILKNEKHPDAIRQTFYIETGKDNVTMKEGYNLLSGRAVEKNLETKEGEKYRAWIQLDFKDTDKHGNFITKQFHQKYGFDLEKSLLALPIQLANPDEKIRLLESLQRGNRQAVTLQVGGQDRKIYIEAAPQFKSLNFYNTEGKRMQLQSILQNPAQAFGEKQPNKETTKQKLGKDGDDLEDSSKKNKQTKRQKPAL
jgi:hypothetical protein